MKLTLIFGALFMVLQISSALAENECGHYEHECGEDFCSVDQVKWVRDGRAVDTDNDGINDSCQPLARMAF